MADVTTSVGGGGRVQEVHTFRVFGLDQRTGTDGAAVKVLPVLLGIFNALDAGFQKLASHVGVDRFQDFLDRLHLRRGLVLRIVVLVATQLGVADVFGIIDPGIGSLPLAIQFGGSRVQRPAMSRGDRGAVAHGVSQVGGHQVLVKVGQARRVVANPREVVKVMRRWRGRGRRCGSACGRVIHDGRVAVGVGALINGQAATTRVAERATVQLITRRGRGAATPDAQRTGRSDGRRRGSDTRYPRFL